MRQLSQLATAQSHAATLSRDKVVQKKKSRNKIAGVTSVLFYYKPPRRLPASCLLLLLLHLILFDTKSKTYLQNLGLT